MILNDTNHHLLLIKKINTNIKYNIFLFINFKIPFINLRGVFNGAWLQLVDFFLPASDTVCPNSQKHLFHMSLSKGGQACLFLFEIKIKESSNRTFEAPKTILVYPPDS